jgi:hypothetical protein
MNLITRAMQSEVVSSSPKKRTITAVWSTDETDHYKTAFVQTGINTSVFRENAVVLWEHGKSAERGSLPVANAVEMGVERFKGRNALIGKSRFWEDEFSEALFQGYASGRLRGWSINVLPREQSPPTPDERRARPDWREADIVYRDTTLVEVSCTSVPGNASALTIGVERGLHASPRVSALTPDMVRGILALEARDREKLGRELAADVGELVKLAVGTALERMSDAELAAAIARLKLEHQHEHWKSVRERQEDFKRRKEEYARRPKGFGL